MAVPIKSDSEIALMRNSSAILMDVFDMLNEEVRVGVNAKYLDDCIRELIISKGAKPAFLGYQGYAYSSCISKNEEIVHGIPYENKVMMPGDICSVDVGVAFNGYISDAARTFRILPVDDKIQKLVDVTEQAFFEAVKQLKPGNRLGDLSYAIQHFVESHHMSVVKDLYSHGVGRELHEEPLIPHYGRPGKGIQLKAGMVFAIEPMVNLGSPDILTLEDKWTIISADRSWSCHYENTVLITPNGPEILTLR